LAFSSVITVSENVDCGQRQHLEGTWDAAGVTKGEIDLSAYLDRIDKCAVWTVTGVGATLWGPNLEDDMTTPTDGKLSIGVCTAADTGGFMAEGPIA
jgi:hypothetical protein